MCNFEQKKAANVTWHIHPLSAAVFPYVMALSHTDHKRFQCNLSSITVALKTICGMLPGLDHVFQPHGENTFHVKVYNMLKKITITLKQLQLQVVVS